jgi:hypothetical protein
MIPRFRPIIAVLVGRLRPISERKFLKRIYTEFHLALLKKRKRLWSSDAS